MIPAHDMLVRLRRRAALTCDDARLVDALHAPALDLMCAALPGIWSWSLFEVHLAPGAAAPVDVSVSLDRRTGGDDALGALLERGLGAAEALRPTLAKWHDRARPFADLNVLWLELDAPTAGRASTMPRGLAFVTLQPSYPGGRTAPRDVIDVIAIAAALDSPERAAALMGPLAALPPGLRELHLGALAPRGVHGFKLDLVGPPLALMRWLALLGWERPIEVHGALAALAAVASELSYSVDLVAGRAARVAVALPLARVLHPAAPSGACLALARALDHLAARGALDPRAIAALARWQGHDAHTRYDLALKVAVTPDGRTAGKLYLGVGVGATSGQPGASARSADSGRA